MPFKLQKSITTTSGLTGGEHSINAGTAQGMLTWGGNTSSATLNGGQQVRVEAGSGVLMVIVLVCDLIFIAMAYSLVCAFIS